MKGRARVKLTVKQLVHSSSVSASITKGGARSSLMLLSLGALLTGASGAGCSAEEGGGNSGTGGQAATGGQPANTGGSTNASGGTTSTGGTHTTGGSVSTGGAPQGGSAVTPAAGNAGAGGAGTGGLPTSGGTASGGTAGSGQSGGNAQGGVGGKGVGGKGGQGGTGGKGSGGGPSSTGGTGGGGAIDVPPGYKLVWHDEFDVDGAPNPANWKFEKGFVRNEEAQWYQPNNASVQGGLLVIEARKERVTNPNYTGKGDWKTTRQYAEYTSSSLNTSGLQSWQYGRFEMRGRIPTKAGMWPAWWTLGVSGEWPSNGEVDIMEFYQGKVLANVACGTSTRYSAKWDSVTKALSTFPADWPSQFHVWRMDWDDQQIVLYLDGQEMNTSTLQSMLNADGTSPFKQKEYMLLNVAIGGMNGGDPSGTTFPQRFEVDYVRVFQKQ
jgi:beta-glucanase (GH16 family)